MRRSSQRSSSVATSASIPISSSSHPPHPHRHHHPSSSPSPNQISSDRFSSSPSPSSPSLFPIDSYLKRYPSILYCNSAKLLSGQPQLVAVCHIAPLLSEEEDNIEQDREDSSHICSSHLHHPDSSVIESTSSPSSSSASSSFHHHHHINSSFSVNDICSSFSLSSVEKGGKNGIQTESTDSSYSQEGRKSNASDPSSSSRTSSSLSSSSSSPSLLRRNRSRHLTAPIPLLLYKSGTGGGDIAVEETTDLRRGKGRTVEEKGGVEEEESCVEERGLFNHRSYSELFNYGDCTEKGGDEEVDEDAMWRNDIKSQTGKGGGGKSNVDSYYSLPGSRGRRGRSVTDASLYDTAVVGNSSSVIYRNNNNSILPCSSVEVSERMYFPHPSSSIKRTNSGEEGMTSVGNSSLDVSDVSSGGGGGGPSSLKRAESRERIRNSLSGGRYAVEAAASPSSSSSPMTNLRGNSRINRSVGGRGGGGGGGGGERTTAATGVEQCVFPCTPSTSTSSSGDVSGNAAVRTYSASRKSHGNFHHSSRSSGIPISSSLGGGGGGVGRLEGLNYVAVAGRSLLQVLSVECSDVDDDDVSSSSSSSHERFSLCPRYTYSKSHVQCLGWRRGIPLTLATLAADGALTCYMKIKKLGGWRSALTIRHPHSRAGTCMEWIGGSDKICCGFMDGAIKVFDVSTAYSSAVSAGGGSVSRSGSSGRSGGGGGGSTANGSGSGGGKGGGGSCCGSLPLLEIRLGSVCVRDLHSRFYSSCGSQTWMSNEVLAAADDGMAHVYDLRMDARHTLHGKAQSFLVSTQALTSARWSCHDTYMFAAASREGIHLWDIRRCDGRPVGMIKTLFPCRCLRWRPGYPTQIASCAAIVDECISLWDLQNPTLPISIFPGHSEIVRDFDWLDEYRLLSCGLDKRLLLHSADRSLQPLTHMTTASVCWSPSDSSSFTLESPFHCSAPSIFGKSIIPPFTSVPDSLKQNSLVSSSSSPRAVVDSSSSSLSSPHLPSPPPPKSKIKVLSTERLTLQFCRLRRPPDNRPSLSSSAHSSKSSEPTYYEQRGFVADLGLSHFPVAEVSRLIMSPKPITRLLRSFRGSAFRWFPSNAIADKSFSQTPCFPCPLPSLSSAPSPFFSLPPPPSPLPPPPPPLPLASSSSSGGTFPPSLSSSQAVPPFPISRGFLSSSPPSRCFGYGVTSSTDSLSYIHYMSQIDLVPDFTSTVKRLPMNVLRPWLQGMLARQIHQRLTFQTLQFVRRFMSQRSSSSSPFSAPFPSFSSSTFSSSHLSPSLFPSPFSSSFSGSLPFQFPSSASFSPHPAASASVSDGLMYPTLFSSSTSAPLLYALQASGMFSSSFSTVSKDEASNLSSGSSSGNVSSTAADLEDFGRSNFDSYLPRDDISYSSILHLSDHELQKFVFHNILLDVRIAQHQQPQNAVEICSSSSSPSAVNADCLTGKYSQYVDSSTSFSRGFSSDASSSYPSFSSSYSSPSPSPSSSSLSPGLCRTSRFSLPQSLPSGGEAVALPFHEICHLYAVLCSQVGEVDKTQVWEYLAVLYNPNPFVSLQLMFGNLAIQDLIPSIFRPEKFPLILEAASSFGTLEKSSSPSSVITSSSSLIISSAAAEEFGKKGEREVGSHCSNELRTLKENEEENVFVKPTFLGKEDNNSTTVESSGRNFESFLRMCSSGCAEISKIVDILGNESFLGKWLETYRRDLIFPVVEYYMKRNDVHMCLALVMNMTSITSYASHFLKSSITTASHTNNASASIIPPPSSSTSVPTTVSNKSSSSSSSSIANTSSSSSAVFSSSSTFRRKENWEGWRPLLICWSFGYVELLRRLRLRVEAVRFICCSPFERIRELGREGLTEGCFACSGSVEISPISSQGSGGATAAAAAGGGAGTRSGGGGLCGKAVERLPFRNSSTLHHSSSSTNSSGNSSSNNGGGILGGAGGGGIMGSLQIDTPAAICSKCKKSKNICAVCGKRVQGLWVSCPVCLHGGHPSHFRIWFERNRQIYCPSGCGHQCQL